MMIRLNSLCLLLFTLMASSASQAAITFVQKNANGIDNTNQTSVSVTISSTGAGNLLAVFVGWEGATAGSTVSVSDGTTSFTGGAQTDGCSGDCHIKWFYLTSANAGKTSITATWTTGRDYPEIHVYEYSYNGKIALDVEKGATGSATAVSSGNFSTTGDTEVVFGSYKIYTTVTLTNPRVNAVAPDQSLIRSSNPLWADSSWSRVVSAPFTGPVSATNSGTSAWACAAISFKIVPPVKHRVTQD